LPSRLRHRARERERGRDVNRKEFIFNLLSFAGTIIIAVREDWQTRDIIWCLWISSLILGYSFIVVSALSIYRTEAFPGSKPGQNLKAAATAPFANRAFAVFGDGLRAAVMNLFFGFVCLAIFGISNRFAWLAFFLCALLSAGGLFFRRAHEPGATVVPRYRVVLSRAFLFTPAVLFTLGFFTVHFGGFHFVHGLFLNTFFPLVPWYPAGKTMNQVFGVFLGLIAHATRSYWPFIFFSALSRKADFERALNAEGGPNMMMPYANVVRMHVMIFVFAGLQAAGLSAYSLYPVLILYFFPAGSLAKLAFQKGRRPKQLA
jgi:hypothetical protein